MSMSEKHDALFAQLVLMFHTATIQHLGKLRDPISGKVERDLEAAQSTIDLLEMLQTKTQGNLSEAESRMLNNILTEVRLNFVDEKNKPAPAPQTSDSNMDQPS